MPGKFLTPLQLVEQATPAVPDSGALGLYAGLDGSLYIQDVTGQLIPLGMHPMTLTLGSLTIPANFQLVIPGDLHLDAGNLMVLGNLVQVVTAPTGTDEIQTFSKAGALTVSTGVGRLMLPYSATILGISAAVNTAPTGATLILDVLKNGLSIYPTTANRPTIAASAFNSLPETVPDDISIMPGDAFTVNIIQVGATIAGSDLTLFVRYRK